MKLYHAGDKGRAICGKDGLSDTTFTYRDVPFRDGSGVAKDILVAVCDTCGDVVAIPPQSTPAIKAAREKASIPVEAKLPASYIEALDLAVYRIDPTLTSDFRKYLLLHYIHMLVATPELGATLGTRLQKFRNLFDERQDTEKLKRLSFKITPRACRDIDALMVEAAINRTVLLKSVVGQIHHDINLPNKPKKLRELRALAATAA